MIHMTCISKTKIKTTYLHAVRGYLPSKLIVISGQSDHWLPVWVIADVDDALNLKGPETFFVVISGETGK